MFPPQHNLQQHPLFFQTTQILNFICIRTLLVFTLLYETPIMWLGDITKGVFTCYLLLSVIAADYVWWLSNAVQHPSRCSLSHPWTHPTLDSQTNMFHVTVSQNKSDYISKAKNKDWHFHSPLPALLIGQNASGACLGFLLWYSLPKTHGQGLACPSSLQVVWGWVSLDTRGSAWGNLA